MVLAWTFRTADVLRVICVDCFVLNSMVHGCHNAFTIAEMSNGYLSLEAVVLLCVQCFRISDT